jgi:hypothetical protein
VHWGTPRPLLHKHISQVLHFTRYMSISYKSHHTWLKISSSHTFQSTSHYFTDHKPVQRTTHQHPTRHVSQPQPHLSISPTILYPLVSSPFTHHYSPQIFQILLRRREHTSHSTRRSPLLHARWPRPRLRQAHASLARRGRLRLGWSGLGGRGRGLV